MKKLMLKCFSCRHAQHYFNKVQQKTTITLHDGLCAVLVMDVLLHVVRQYFSSLECCDSAVHQTEPPYPSGSAPDKQRRYTSEQGAVVLGTTVEEKSN